MVSGDGDLFRAPPTGASRWSGDGSTCSFYFACILTSRHSQVNGDGGSCSVSFASGSRVYKIEVIGFSNSSSGSGMYMQPMLDINPELRL
nr:uncharacterized protein LOC127321906 isoform X3 [Lolium perenne]